MEVLGDFRCGEHRQIGDHQPRAELRIELPIGPRPSQLIRAVHEGDRELAAIEEVSRGQEDEHAVVRRGVAGSGESVEPEAEDPEDGGKSSALLHGFRTPP